VFITTQYIFEVENASERNMRGVKKEHGIDA
jgi:hypothetical protein